MELFGLTANEDGTESEALLNEIVSLQKEINTELGLHCRYMMMHHSLLLAPVAVN